MRPGSRPHRQLKHNLWGRMAGLGSPACRISMGSSKIKTIAKYHVLDVLGKGGMGVVYKATDPAIGRLVAIKMITGGHYDDAEFLKRFYREAQSTGKLQHRNIV